MSMLIRVKGQFCDGCGGEMTVLSIRSLRALLEADKTAEAQKKPQLLPYACHECGHKGHLVVEA